MNNFTHLLLTEVQLSWSGQSSGLSLAIHWDPLQSWHLPPPILLHQNYPGRYFENLITAVDVADAGNVRWIWGLYYDDWLILLLMLWERTLLVDCHDCHSLQHCFRLASSPSGPYGLCCGHRGSLTIFCRFVIKVPLACYYSYLHATDCHWKPCYDFEQVIDWKDSCLCYCFVVE